MLAGVLAFVGVLAARGKQTRQIIKGHPGEARIHLEQAVSGKTCHSLRFRPSLQPQCKGVPELTASTFFVVKIVLWLPTWQDAIGTDHIRWHVCQNGPSTSSAKAKGCQGGSRVEAFVAPGEDITVEHEKELPSFARACHEFLHLIKHGLPEAGKVLDASINFGLLLPTHIWQGEFEAPGIRIFAPLLKEFSGIVFGVVLDDDKLLPCKGIPHLSQVLEQLCGSISSLPNQASHDDAQLRSS
mmetsp:Transcript_96790/g.172183  ORF Transcript_96790/g.172183 Transcript_96790/m.172183 type:complete len:242 (+) Transcript_96790:186-911(+)